MNTRINQRVTKALRVRPILVKLNKHLRSKYLFKPGRNDGRHSRARTV